MGSSFCGSLQLQYTSGVRIGKPLPRAAHNEASNQREHEHSRREISLCVRVIASDFPVAAFPSNISRKWHYGSLDHCAERYLLAMTRIRYGLGSCRKEGSCSASCRDDLYLKVLNMSRGGTPNLSSSVSGLPVVFALLGHLWKWNVLKFSLLIKRSIVGKALVDVEELWKPSKWGYAERNGALTAMGDLSTPKR